MARFKRLDSLQFVVDLHANRHWVGHCRIELKLRGTLEGISYSNDSGGAADSFIESLSAERWGELYRLRLLGIRLRRLRDLRFTAEEGAWTYWQMFTAPNQTDGITGELMRYHLKSHTVPPWTPMLQASRT